jgi:hypothetical protein
MKRLAGGLAGGASGLLNFDVLPSVLAWFKRLVPFHSRASGIQDAVVRQANCWLRENTWMR